MENKISIYEKLLAVQQALVPIMKDKNNPFFKSKYADINSFIEAIKPVLNENKLILLQPLTTLGEGIALKTILADAETGETLEDTVPILTKELDPQKIGSAVTYYRRYALQSLLLIQAEDDDGNATKPAPKVVAKPVTKPVTVTKKDVDEKIVPLLTMLSYNTDNKEAIKNAVLATTKMELNVANFDKIVTKLKEVIENQ